MVLVTITDCSPGRQGPVQTSAIAGWKDSSFENITLENVKIVHQGGDTNRMEDFVPPYPKDYSPRSLGPRPASAFYIRHVQGLTFKNVEFGFEADDQRAPPVIYGVDGLTFDNLKVRKTPAGVETMRLEKVKNLTVRNSPGLADRKAETMDKSKE